MVTIPRLDALLASDVYAVFHLIGEVVERGEDPLGWRAHLMGWLRAHLRARSVLDAETAPELRGPRDVLAAVICREGTPEQVAATTLAPVWAAVSKAAMGTERRGALLGAGECLLSVRTLPGLRTLHVLAVSRAAGDPSFDERDRQLLGLLHDELARHVSVPPAAGKPLTPVLRATLGALLAGDSEKEAADRLQIGLDALHDRIRRLYRHIGAHSRGELIAKATSQYYIPRPRLHVPSAGPARRAA